MSDLTDCGDSSSQVPASRNNDNREYSNDACDEISWIGAMLYETIIVQQIVECLQKCSSVPASLTE